MKNIMHERSVLERKIREGSLIEADLQMATAIAKDSGATKDRVNFAKVKQILSNKAELIDGGLPNGNDIN